MDELLIILRKPDDFKPILAEDFDQVHQRFERHGLGHIGIHSQIVASQNVFLGL
jgi:hypothetical protein